jgi:hypothetical protein
VLITTSARRVLGTMRVCDRHPVRAGAIPKSPMAKACRSFICICTNCKYIYLRAHSYTAMSYVNQNKHVPMR